MDPLFRRIFIGPVELKNRIFMPAMHLNMCRDFKVTEQLIEFYRERAKGGVALISVGYATIDEFSGTPLNIGAHSDEPPPAYQKISSTFGPPASVKSATSTR